MSHELCGRCRHPLWSLQHYWQCGWRDESYNYQGQKKKMDQQRVETQMGKPVPKFIAEMYGSAHNFRSAKRVLVRRMISLTKELRRGCAYFPMGNGPVDRIQTDLELLKDRLSTRRWGK